MVKFIQEKRKGLIIFSSIIIFLFIHNVLSEEYFGIKAKWFITALLFLIFYIGVNYLEFTEETGESDVVIIDEQEQETETEAEEDLFDWMGQSPTPKSKIWNESSRQVIDKKKGEGKNV